MITRVTFEPLIRGTMPLICRVLLAIWLVLGIYLPFGDSIPSKIASEADLVELGRKSNSWALSCTLQRPGDAIQGVFGKDVGGMPVMLHTPCLELDSLGNFLSEYFESMLCAAHVRVHYATTSFLNPSLKGEGMGKDFFEYLPKVLMHSDPLESKEILQCPCTSICHEWIRGLMHHNGRMVKLGKWFRTAMDAWTTSRLGLVNSTRSSLQDQIVATPFREDYVRQTPQAGASFRISVGAEGGSHEIQSLPFIPDAAIHYRCGDNLVTHYGFLPFRAFKRVIPPGARSIYVMAESSKRRANRHESVQRCDAIFTALEIYLRMHFPRAAIVFLRGQPLFDDLARLTYARTVVCSVSTFCLWPAVASGGPSGTTTEGTRAYFPVSRLIAKGNTSMDYGKGGFAWLDPSERIVLGRDTIRMRISKLIQILQQ